MAIGAGSQLVLIRVVYLPLEALWPGTFTEDRLTENAQDLVDRAGGASTLLLFAVVVIGAPVVEELFYRGLLQRSLAARFNEGAVLVAVAAIFATVHFRPVEFPGLFVFGLVLGWARTADPSPRAGDHHPHRVQPDRAPPGPVIGWRCDAGGRGGFAMIDNLMPTCEPTR